SISFTSFIFNSCFTLCVLHSFPTRRSSDLLVYTVYSGDFRLLFILQIAFFHLYLELQSVLIHPEHMFCRSLGIFDFYIFCKSAFFIFSPNSKVYYFIPNTCSIVQNYTTFLISSSYYISN